MRGNHLWSSLGRNSFRALLRRRQADAHDPDRLQGGRVAQIRALTDLQLETYEKPANLRRPDADGRRLDRPAPADQAAATQPAHAALGWLPYLASSAAAGVALCTIGDALSRSMRSASQLPFWAGLLVILVPIAYRLASTKPGRSERLSLVVVLGFALYLVKVVQNPFGFTYADELVHAYNAEQILHTHSLFGHNTILPVTTRYPGLETVVSAVSATTGLGTYGAGLIVIGMARLLIMLSLYLLFERVAGSARIASLGTLVYAANSNFLFFSAQFSYESLALPLLVFVLALVAERQATEGGLRDALAVPILLGTCAVVVTHHLTSYALVGALTGLAAAAALRGRRQLARSPWPYAGFALAVSVAWLFVVASVTVGYVTPVLTRALAASFHTLSGEAAPRHLFSSSESTGYRAPLLERVIGLGSVAALAAATPFGLRRMWRRGTPSPFALLFSVGALGFFGILFLRFAPAAWETANRASEFLYIGLAFVVAQVQVGRWIRRQRAWLAAAVTATWIALVFAGGVIAGWDPSLRLSQPYRLEAEGTAIDPEGRLLAAWAAGNLGTGLGFAATEADARFLLAYAREKAVAGTHPDVRDVLASPTLPAWQLSLLRDNGLRFVAVDLRKRSTDAMSGYYFALETGRRTADELVDRRAATKFDAARADRLFDSGSILVYDLGRAFGAASKR